MTDSNTLVLLIPEICLVVAAVWVFLASAFQPSRAWAWFCAVVLVVVGVALWRQDAAIWGASRAVTEAAGQRFSGPLFVDAFGHLGRWLAIVLAMLFLPLAAFSGHRGTSGEFVGSILLAFAGFMIVATAADLVLLLLGLELISVPTYVLLFLGRSDRRGAEATTKYFFLSILSSALFLYGLSFVYGAAGSTHLGEIHSRLAVDPDARGVPFITLAMVLLLAGLGFKIAAVPFHFYAPDVYQATSNANAGLLAVLPKAAGMIAIVRVGHALAAVDSDTLVQLIILMSIASMTLGNTAALWQSDLRRMLAYSSVAHAGYLLIGLAAGFAGGSTGYVGIGASVFYLITYCLASLGAFATLAYLSNDSEECSLVTQLTGLPHRHPIAAFFLAIFMFSLSGIPPLAGFWGKLALFQAAIPNATGGVLSIWFTALLLAAAVNAAIAAGYYLRVIAQMYFASPDDLTSETTYGVSFMPGVTVLACGVMVLVCGFAAGPLVGWSAKAGRSLAPEGVTATESQLANSPKNW